MKTLCAPSEDQTVGRTKRQPQPRPVGPLLSILALLAALLLLGPTSAHASIAYGSINNFDTVNDTSNVCHGFEIELDDIRSSDITYTYDYNHYGTPNITEVTSSDSLGLHTNVLVRYQAVWSGSAWSAYTAVPTNNIPPTQGHAFTNPSLNFGGEHFGVGYRRQPTKVCYHWLLDTGSHTLSLGPQVYVSTPTFTYNPPPLPAQPAVIQANIPAPVQPPPPPWSTFEFSDAVWVKEIVTTTHTNDPVELRDLVTPDTNNPTAKDWRNGQDAQVEIQWQLLQTDFKSTSGYNPTNGIGGANGQLGGPNQGVNHSDDVVTTRYEFYVYNGPYDDPNGGTHEALAQTVAADNLHGVGWTTNSNGDVFDLSTNEVVGKFLGAQMSGMAAAPPIGLIDHLPDGELNLPYADRSLVIAGDTNFTATLSGHLPTGLYFDPGTSIIYGTPTESGNFLVTITATATNKPVLVKRYPFTVGGANLPAHSAVDTLPSPLSAGSTAGDGVYTNGTTTTVLASPNAGYRFAYWTENGAVVSTTAAYTFTNILNRSLVANFGPNLSLSGGSPHALVLTWLTNFPTYTLQQTTNLGTTNWSAAAEPFSIVGSNYQTTVQTTNGLRFFRLQHP